MKNSIKRCFKLILIMIMLFPFIAKAENKISNIDIDIYVNKDGSADVEEKWNVVSTEGTEWYKSLNGITIDDISNFTVLMDGKELINKTWDTNESQLEKAGYYGINETSEGIELCWGRVDDNQHLFTISYKLNKFVYNVDDAQIIYQRLIPKIQDVTLNNYQIKISSYYSFSDDLDVWAFGGTGYNYVKDGSIYSSNLEDEDVSEYITILVKFPLNTFDSINVFEKASTFEEVEDMATNNTYNYDYDEDNEEYSEYEEEDYYNYEEDDDIEDVFIVILLVLLGPTIAGIMLLANQKKEYGFANGKIINKKDVPNFREIPCNKDIYYADTLIKLNNKLFDYNETNIFGAIILKWVKEDKIIFIKLGKNKSKMDLTKDVTFDNDFEKKLFDYMKSASKDGILESKEFEKWIMKDYEKFLNLFKDRVDDSISKLKNINEIKINNNKELNYKMLLSDKIYEDSVQLYGLKKYLLEFSRIKEKEVIEVKIWDEYLMFAYLFGIADKVAKQLKKFYPELIENSNYNYDFDFEMITCINDFSHSSTTAISSARAAAENYSAGGGGFNIGGGGGGSIGDGGTGGLR